MLITLIGCLTGLGFGALICELQLQFGFIKIGDAASFVVDAYPVAMQVSDFILSFFIVLIIGASASFYTSQKLVTRFALIALKA